MNKPILHAGFIEVDDKCLIHRQLFNLQKLPNQIPDFLCSVSACVTKPFAEIQQETNEWLGQSQEVEQWRTCYRRNDGKQCSVKFVENDLVAIVDSGVIGYDEMPRMQFDARYFITPQSAEVPDFSDDKVVKFEMEGLRVDFVKIESGIVVMLPLYDYYQDQHANFIKDLHAKLEYLANNHECKPYLDRVDFQDFWQNSKPTKLLKNLSRSFGWSGHNLFRLI